MFKISTRVRFLCLVLSLAIAFQPLIIAAEEEADSKPQEGEFNPAEALSPGEYLAEIKKLRGSNTQEVEEQSYADWGNIMMNVFVMCDPKAIDVPTYQKALNTTLSTVEKVVSLTKPDAKWVKILGKITTWGLTKFSEGNTQLFQRCKNFLESWAKIMKRPGVDKIREFGTYMTAPDKGGAQWIKKTSAAGDAADGASKLSSLGKAATVVGTALQLLAGAFEIKNFFDRLGDDPGAVSWGTVQHGIEGALLIATAIMAFIPPPGVWSVVAIVIMAIWDRLKDVFNRIGEKIQKWHKAYEDSLVFMRELDDDFATFLEENKTSTTFGCDQEKSASLKYADDMLDALQKSPGEGDIAQRQDELVQNMRAQGILTTYYYQQATAASQLTANQGELFQLWNHRADYMAWKPEKPKWSWNPIKLAGSVGDWAVDSMGQLILGTDDQIKEDLKEHPFRVHFCPDFALITLYRNFIVQKRTPDASDLPPLLSLTGIRIEQAPFNFIPLVDIYADGFKNWTDEVLREANAADAINVGTKELPIIRELIKGTKDEFGNCYGALLLKIQGLDPKSDMGKDKDKRALLYIRMFQILAAGASKRAQLEKLVSLYEEGKKDQPLKDEKIEYEEISPNGDRKTVDRKLVDELFKGKDLEGPPWLSVPRINTALLKDKNKDREKPKDEELTAAYIFQNYGQDLALSLQCMVNTTGISGIDVVQMGMQTKNSLDVLELATRAMTDRREAFDSLGDVLKTEAFKRLIEKGEYLDVTRGGLENFFSGFDPPKDVLEHEIGEFEKAIKECVENVLPNKAMTEELQKEFKVEYARWLEVLKKYEESKDDMGIEIGISASDPNYSADLLDFVTPIEVLDPEKATQ